MNARDLRLAALGVALFIGMAALVATIGCAPSVYDTQMDDWRAFERAKLAKLDVLIERVTALEHQTVSACEPPVALEPEAPGVPSSNPALRVDRLGTTDGITILTFFDGCRNRFLAYDEGTGRHRRVGLAP